MLLMENVFVNVTDDSQENHARGSKTLDTIWQVPTKTTLQCA